VRVLLQGLDRRFPKAASALCAQQSCFSCFLHEPRYDRFGFLEVACASALANAFAVDDLIRALRVHDLKHPYGHRLRVAGVGFEDRKVPLGHDHVTTNYSPPEVGTLIEASEKVCACSPAKVPHSPWLEFNKELQAADSAVAMEANNLRS